jgi:hypothetical protein
MLKLHLKTSNFIQIRSVLSNRIIDHASRITESFSNFDELTQHRFEQAKRTALFEYNLDHGQAFLTNILKQLDQNEAKIKKIFYHINQKHNSLLVEFDSTDNLHKFIQSRPGNYTNYSSQESIFNHRCFHCTDFVFDSVILQERLDYLKRIAAKLIHIEVKRIRDNSKRGHTALEELYPNDLESQIKELYEMKKLNEMSIRIRYFFASLLSEKLGVLCLPSRGSFSLFAKFDHDLDLAIEMPNNDKRIVEFLLSTLQSLQNCNDITELQYYYKRVPILKFKHHILFSNLDVHISANSINNKQSYLMTKLLWTYSMLDMNLVYLMSFFRYWATELDIIDTLNKDEPTFNFFVLNLLVLHFLTNFKLLPSMSELIVNRNEDILSPYEVKFNRPNQSPDLIKCILGFFAFYSQFDFESTRINFISDIKEIDRLTRLRRRPFIEQPFINGANVAFKVDMNEIDDFKEKCLYSFNKIKSDSNLISCINEIRDYFINKLD